MSLQGRLTPGVVRRQGARVLALVLAACIAGCASAPVVPDGQFKPAEKKKVDFATPEVLAAFDAPAEAVFRLGEGDEIQVDVWGRPQLSGEHVIGPDGRITVPIGGIVPVAGLARDEAANKITEALAPYYFDLGVSVKVQSYVSNRILLLGRVENPGIVRFETQPTLLEALARGGTLPVLDKQATLTRCAIFRGRDRVLWIDLQQLLAQGALTWNIRLQPNDLIYIPDSDDTLVYVLGEVHRPGAYRLTPGMTFMDALSQSGGPTVDSDKHHIWVIRPSANDKRMISLDEIMEPNASINYALQEGDIVYVPRNGLAKVGYVLDKLSPIASVILIKAVAD